MQSQKRWGILALAVVMFFATTVAMQIFGNLLSMFGAAWIMIGWYAYKGELQSANSWTKWAIFVGIGVVVLSYLFIGDNNNAATMRVKNQSAIGVGVMAVPLILLYFYLLSQMTKIVNNTETGGNKNINSKNNINSPPNTYSASATPFNKKSSAVAASVQASSSPTVNDEIYYERALKEFESDRRKGLWIKLLTHNEGDEVKSKFQYIKARAQEIQAEDAEVEQQRLAAMQQAANEQERERLLLQTRIGNHQVIKIEGKTCLLLQDGKVLYQLKSGDYLIYSSKQWMSVYFQYGQENVGFLGVLKKDDGLDFGNKKQAEREIISCKKCSQKIRVENKTGMVECPSCSHSWLFERKDISSVSNSSRNGDLEMEGSVASAPGEVILTVISWGVMIFLGLIFLAVIIYE